MSRFTEWWSWPNWRFAQLLLFTVASLLLVGLQLRLAALISQLVILNGVVVASSMPEVRFRGLRPLLIGSWLVNLVLQAGALAPRGSGFYLLADAAGAAMLAVCVLVILTHVLRSREVTADTIFAAIVAYLFIALTFSRIYEVLQSVQPGSFGPAEGGYNALELAYFSLVTIATLGYGDILPRTPLSQVLATLEAVIGQFYVAVLVAWLVTAYASERERRRG